MTVPEVDDYTQICFPLIPMLIAIVLIWLHAKLLVRSHDPEEYVENFRFYLAVIRLYSEREIIRDIAAVDLLRMRPADAA